GITRARSVGRIVYASSRNTVGTCVLVRGRDLGSGLSDELLLITNAHVMTDNPARDEGEPPSQVVALFEQLGGAPVTLPIDSIVFISPRLDLDVTIAKLAAPGVAAAAVEAL